MNDTDWNSLSDEQKQSVLQACNVRIEMGKMVFWARAGGLAMAVLGGLAYFLSADAPGLASTVGVLGILLFAVSSFINSIISGSCRSALRANDIPENIVSFLLGMSPSALRRFLEGA